MRSFNISWRSIRALLMLVGMTFLFNLPGLVSCHSSIDTTAESEYSWINSSIVTTSEGEYGWINS
jgi:hypothetical protein